MLISPLATKSAPYPGMALFPTITTFPFASTPPKPLLATTWLSGLVEIGVNDVFSIPGDFNLTLPDHLLAEPGLNLVGCCNELNVESATDGYAILVASVPASSPSPSAD